MDEWEKLIGDVPKATAILDRLLSRADLIYIVGKATRCATKLANLKVEMIKKKHNT